MEKDKKTKKNFIFLNLKKKNAYMTVAAII